MLDDRKVTILSLLVERYIRTGEPVSSRAIHGAGHLDVSTATIRNELVSLEREGYIFQPHTSAGRVPTDLGYRFYIDHLRLGRMRAHTRSTIDGFFEAVHDELGDLLRQTTELLSRMTDFPAVVMGPAFGPDRVHAVHLVLVSDHAYLAVLITESGRVTKELGRVRRVITDADARTAERLIADKVVGLPIDDAITAIGKADTARVSAGVKAIVASAGNAILAGAEAAPEVFVGGTSRLAALWQDLTKVHSLLEALERQALLMSLLAGDELGTAVRLGGEIPDIADDDFAVVSTGFATGGRIGVIGPKRMDYRRTIRVVEGISDGLSDRLAPE